MVGFMSFRISKKNSCLHKAIVHVATPDTTISDTVPNRVRVSGRKRPHTRPLEKNTPPPPPPEIIVHGIDILTIPIILICFNNHEYIEYAMKQAHHHAPYHKIIIIDNCSTRPGTLDFLKHLETKATTRLCVIRSPHNNGPWIYNDDYFWDMLPDYFILTDPDLEWNNNLPENFISILFDVMIRLKEQRVGKIGFALDISEPEKMYPYKTYGHGDETIWEWESKFWTSPCDDPRPSESPRFPIPMYYAAIDTTLALYDKSLMRDPNGFSMIRVAGDLTARHLPWYITPNPVLTIEQQCAIYKSQTYISSIAAFFLAYHKDLLS